MLGSDYRDEAANNLTLIVNLDYENFIQIAQADIADALEMQKTHVSRAVRALLDVGVIFEGP
ncbi:hypothetical protein ACSLOD_28135, partial [Escherichia coli]